MKTRDREPSIRFAIEGDTVTIIIAGDLRSLSLGPIESFLNRQIPKLITTYRYIVWNMDKVCGFDTAAALMIQRYISRMYARGCRSEVKFLKPEFDELFGMVRERRHKIAAYRAPKPFSWIERLGQKSQERFHLLIDILVFFGTVNAILLTYLRHVKNVRFKEIMFEINESAIKAMGIVALTTFLIGVVIAYQSSVQLKLYGANIFIVDMLGISIFRELAPLITAIVVAGRSGSAYAAQIGVMKITEELDAMRTMGFDPYAFLVLPRIIALMVMMPILIFFADIMGVLGGMIVSNIELGLSYQVFLERFSNVINIRHFWIGLFKGPFFALLIALIAIYRGMRVKNDTQSIGFNTTKSVVESIFAVIICDAVFSIVFTNLEL